MGGRNQPQLQHLPINALKPYGNRARRHSRGKLEKLKRSIRRYGPIGPIVVDDENVIINGHAFWEAQRELGYEEVAVIVVQNRDPAELKALRLMLNRIVDQAKWDKSALRSEFQELLEVSFELDLTGFDTIEIEHILELDPKHAEKLQADVVPVLETYPITQPGDIWICGRHRIGCGDPRDEQFARSVCGTHAAMAFIDNSQGCEFLNIDDASSDSSKELREASAGATLKFLTESLRLARALCAPEALIYVCTIGQHIADLLAAGKVANSSLLDVCVWVKSEPEPGLFYQSQHELVCVFGSDLRESVLERRRNRAEKRSNVWAYDIGMSARATEIIAGSVARSKPVALVADAIRDATRHGALVLDTLLGTGATLMAAEETGRVCAGIDANPRYVDIAVRRWQAEAKRCAIHAERGSTFDAGRPKIDLQAGEPDRG
jgi:DNA modification methylase